MKVFFKCKNLKQITIKSKVLNRMYVNTFKGVSRKCVVKTPSSKKSNYIHLFRYAGFKGKIK